MISRDHTLDGNGFTIYGRKEDLSVCLEVSVGMHLVVPDIPGGDGSADGGPSGDTAPPHQPSPPETSEGNTTASIQVVLTVSGDTAKAEMNAGVMDRSVETVMKAAVENNTSPVVQIIVDSGEICCVEVLLPGFSLNTLGRHESASLTVSFDVATVARGEQIAHLGGRATASLPHPGQTAQSIAVYHLDD